MRIAAVTLLLITIFAPVLLAQTRQLPVETDPIKGDVLQAEVWDFSQQWIRNVRAKESNFQYLKSGKNKGHIKISEKLVYAIVKCNKINDCPYLFTLGSENDNLSVKFIDSIMNFNEYIEDNDSIDKDVKYDAEYLKNSDKNFIYTNLSD